MSATAAESADADTDDESFTYYPQVKQHPHSIIAGTIVDIVPGYDLDGDQETPNGNNSIGVVFEDPTVVVGEIWKNRDAPEAFDTIGEYHDTLKMASDPNGDYIRDREVTEEAVETARERLVEAGILETGDEDIDISYTPQDGMSAVVDSNEDVAASGQDFKIANSDDAKASVQEVEGTTLGIDVGGGVFSAEKKDSLGVDRIMVWYGGLAGQRIGRALDFNGRPSARYKDDGYLVKGLYQHPIGWFDRDTEQFDNVPTTDRGKLASDDGFGRPPRAVRPPVRREDLADAESFIELFRPSPDARSIFATVGLNEGDWTTEDYLDAREAANSGDGWISDELDGLELLRPRYEQSPEEVLADAFENPNQIYALYHGEGWQPKPDNAMDVLDTGDDDAEGGSFDIEMADDSVEHPTENEREFAEEVARRIQGTEASPDDEIFGEDDNKMDLSDLVGANGGAFETEPDVEAIRELVYENTSHLDPGDL